MQQFRKIRLLTKEYHRTFFKNIYFEAVVKSLVNCVIYRPYKGRRTSSLQIYLTYKFDLSLKKHAKNAHL